MKHTSRRDPGLLYPSSVLHKYYYWSIRKAAKTLTSTNDTHIIKDIATMKKSKMKTPPSNGNSSSTLDRFLVEINNILLERDGTRLLDYLVIEPPYSALYMQMIAELRRDYPRFGNTGQKLHGDADLENLCERKLRDVLSSDATADGSTGMGWSAFGKFLIQYFVFLREVDVGGGHLLETYNLLSEVVQ